ncbi:hypothetical protein Dimus_034115 [Dionaea muscipula]
MQYSEVNRESMRLACERLKELLAREDGFFRQIENEEWINFVDRNTRYFYNLISGHRRKARICGITSRDGTVVSSNAEIGSVFIEFYESLLGSTFVPADLLNSEVLDEGPRLSHYAVAFLDRDFSGGIDYTVRKGYMALRGCHAWDPAWCKVTTTKDQLEAMDDESYKREDISGETKEEMLGGDCIFLMAREEL